MIGWQLYILAIRSRPSVTKASVAILHRRQKTTRQSTAYLNFRTAADLLYFKAAFEGTAFNDARGKQQPCSVEYAPFQRVPRSRVKRDPREGTIDKGAQTCVTLRNVMHQHPVYQLVAPLQSCERAWATVCVTSSTHHRPVRQRTLPRLQLC